MNQDAVAARSVFRHETGSRLTRRLMSETTFTMYEDGRVDHHSGRRWCHHCRGVGDHYTQDHPVSGTLSRGPDLVLEQAEATADRACEACTGDGGRGHTMRGACMGSPCPECGDPRYRHLNGEHGVAVRVTLAGVRDRG